MNEYIGRIVRHDLTNAHGTILVSAGTCLSEEHVKLLRKHDVDPFSFRFEAEYQERLERSVDQAIETSRSLFDSIDGTGCVPVDSIKNDLLPTIRQAADHSNVYQLFAAVKATDEYTYRHNIAVGVLSTLIGGWLGLPEEELSLLSLAATLHDVGKVKIDAAVLNKPGKLTNEEFALIKQHTLHGYHLLKNTPGLPYRVALVALQHHERNDGSGYPLGSREEETDRFSKIVAVADIFHAMSSKRPYHEPMPFFEIVSQMRQGKFGQLDPSIVSVFLDRMQTKILGEYVVLTDGSVGKVVYLNPHRPEAPLIQAGDTYIDLGQRPDLHIREVQI